MLSTNMTNHLALTTSGKLLRMVTDSIATPICQIFNLSLVESLCPQAWREAKVIPVPKKNGKTAFTGSKNCQLSTNFSTKYNAISL